MALEIGMSSSNCSISNKDTWILKAHSVTNWLCVKLQGLKNVCTFVALIPFGMIRCHFFKDVKNETR